MNRRVTFAGALVLIAACTAAPGPTETATLPTQTPASPTLAPTASPSPTVAPTPSPTTTAAPTRAPTATPAADHPVIELFLTDFAARQPPFHVLTDIVGTVSAGAQEVQIGLEVEGDISGQDFTGHVSGSTLGKGVDVGIIFVDGVAYNDAGGSWAVVDDFQQAQPLNPFSRLNPSDLSYGGSVIRDGQTLHRLQTETWIGEAVENVEGIPDAQLEGSTFDIFVGDDGVPVEARLVFAIVGTYNGIPTRIDYTVDYVFTNVGVPVTIEAPTIE